MVMFEVGAKSIFVEWGGLTTLVDTAQFLLGKGSASIYEYGGRMKITHEGFNQINFCKFITSK